LFSRKQDLLKAKRKLYDVEQDVLSKVSDDHAENFFWRMALRYGITQVESELQWIAECFHALYKDVTL